MKFLYKLFGPKSKKIITIYDDNREIPILKVNKTYVPQAYLNEIKKWDSHLYHNQEVVN